MSKLIAPGEWDASGKRLAKGISFLVGVVLILWSLRQVDALIKAAENGVEIGIWSVVLVLIPMAIGGAATFPGVVTPLIYRVIDGFSKRGPTE